MQLPGFGLADPAHLQLQSSTGDGDDPADSSYMDLDATFMQIVLEYGLFSGKSEQTEQSSQFFVCCGRLRRRRS